MPIFIPILIGGGVALASVYGAKKGYDGYSDLKKAKRKAKGAKDRHTRASQRLNNTRSEVNDALTAYGHKIVQIHDTTIKRMMAILDAIGKKARRRAFSILEDLDIQHLNLQEYRTELLDAELAGGMLGSAATGIAAGQATAAAVGAFGTASTGAAISGLSGAAAHSATMAWLGGGALAAGGGGMALGTVVLGGIGVAPALLLGGLSFSSKGQKALTQARRYEAKVNYKIAKIRSLQACMRRIVKHVDTLDNVLVKLDERANSAMDDIDCEHFDSSSDDDVAGLAKAMHLTLAMNEIMRTPILDEQGSLSNDTIKVLWEYRKIAFEDE